MPPLPPLPPPGVVPREPRPRVPPVLEREVVPRVRDVAPRVVPGFRLPARPPVLPVDERLPAPRVAPVVVALMREVPVAKVVPRPVVARVAPPLLERLPAVPEDLARPEDFARLVPLLVAFLPVLVERDLVEPVPLEREAVLRDPADPDFAVRPVLPRLVAPAPLVSPSSPVHLPDIMRCAASATASAISEPSREALEATLLAACWAVSAASTPASRILRRAAGLALIAAAAAASPAASISRLIAALAILSTVLSLELPDFEACDFEAFDFEARGLEERVEPVELFRLVDLAIANLPSVAIKDTSDA